MVRPGLPVLSVVEGYRFGFNGKEMDHEAKGNFAQLDYGERIYDPRVGRWLSLDPLQRKYPNESNYAFVSNSPNIYADSKGKDKIVTITFKFSNGKTLQIQMTDKDYFEYYRDRVYYGFPQAYKADRAINLTIDFSKSSLSEIFSFSSERINPKPISNYEKSSIPDIIRFLSGSGDESDKVKYGYRIYGGKSNSQDPYIKGLPKPAGGSESLDLGEYLEFVGGGVREEAAVGELVNDLVKRFGGVKGNDMKHLKIALDYFSHLLEKAAGVADNSSKAAERIKRDNKEKETVTIKKIVPSTHYGTPSVVHKKASDPNKPDTTFIYIPQKKKKD